MLRKRGSSLAMENESAVMTHHLRGKVATRLDNFGLVAPEKCGRRNL